MTEELLEKIPPEKRWEITSKILSSIVVMRGEKIIAPELGKGEGITSPVLGIEKWKEINIKIFGEYEKYMFPMIRDMFNIPVGNAKEVDDLAFVIGALETGPEWQGYFVEQTPEKVIYRNTKCPWWERYKEFKVDPAFIPCGAGHQLWGEEGCKSVNPKVTFKLTKAMPWGDPYCEEVFEFKNE